jgi:CRP-like cAMP-binding protein
MKQKVQIAMAQFKATLAAFAEIPESEWTYAVSFMTTRTFESGAYLVREGEYLDCFYFIVKGLVRFYYATEDGKIYNKHFAMENGFAGSLRCFVLRAPCPFYIQTLEPTETIVLPHHQLLKQLDRHPCWERLMRKNAEQLVLLKEDREKAFLLDSLEVRYRRFIETYPNLANRIPQYHIASYLGVTDVALSRIRKKI